MNRTRLAPSGRLRTNAADLVTISVAGEIASPMERGTPWRIGYDGRLRSLPGSGGIVPNHRVGDRCVGLAADHIEPAVSIRNEQRASGANADGPNQALQTLACVGNLAIVTSGAASGRRGVVTGKHGGVDTVIVDFPAEVMRRMAIGDRIQVWAMGQGLRLIDFPSVSIWNCSPRLLSRWRPQVRDGRIHARVTHRIPAAILGSGLGRNNVVRGDYDIQMSDPRAVRRYGLGSLRFGDMVGIVDADNRYGRSRLEGQVSIGVIVHGDSTVAGHGPGVVSLMSGPAALIHLSPCRSANIAAYLDIRTPVPPRVVTPLPIQERNERTVARLRETVSV